MKKRNFYTNGILFYTTAIVITLFPDIYEASFIIQKSHYLSTEMVRIALLEAHFARFSLHNISTDIHSSYDYAFTQIYIRYGRTCPSPVIWYL